MGTRSSCYCGPQSGRFAVAPPHLTRLDPSYCVAALLRLRAAWLAANSEWRRLLVVVLGANSSC